MVVGDQTFNIHIPHQQLTAIQHTHSWRGGASGKRNRLPKHWFEISFSHHSHDAANLLKATRGQQVSAVRSDSFTASRGLALELAQVSVRGIVRPTKANNDATGEPALRC